jgi:primosomal protein N'
MTFTTETAYHLLRCPMCDYGKKNNRSGVYKVYKQGTTIYLVCKRCKHKVRIPTLI